MRTILLSFILGGCAAQVAGGGGNTGTTTGTNTGYNGGGNGGDADTDIDADSDSDTDTTGTTTGTTGGTTTGTTGNTNDGEGNFVVQVDDWTDSSTLGLDYEAVDDVDFLGTISADLWEDQGGYVTPVDSVATWVIEIPSDTVAVRIDVDFEGGGNLCEDYGNDAHMQADAFGWWESDPGTVYEFTAWSFSWEDNGVTYYGCSGETDIDPE